MFFKTCGRRTFLKSLKILKILGLSLLLLQIFCSSSLRAEKIENGLKREIIENINLYLEKELPKNLTWQIKLPGYLSYLEKEEEQKSNQKIKVSIPQESKKRKTLIAQLKITDQNDHSEVIAIPIKITEKM